MKLPRVNAYVCKCRHLTITVDVDKGTTPMFIPCESCSDSATSLMYYPALGSPVMPAPSQEWYKPIAEEKIKLSPGELDHVVQGGLLMRERTKKEPIYFEVTK